MGPKFSKPTPARLADPDAERVRRSHEQRIDDLKKIPIVGGHCIPRVSLADGKPTPIAHGMGRPVFHCLGAPRASASATTGRITMPTTAEFDPSRFLVLQADGWGETITVDVWVY